MRDKRERGVRGFGVRCVCVCVCVRVCVCVGGGGLWVWWWGGGCGGGCGGVVCVCVGCLVCGCVWGGGGLFGERFGEECIVAFTPVSRSDSNPPVCVCLWTPSLR